MNINDFKGITWSGSLKKFRTSPTTWFHEGMEDDIKDFKELGVRWVRMGFGQDMPYEDVDYRVNLLLDNNIEPLLYWRKFNPKTDWGTPQQEAENAEHLKAFVRRYRGKIKCIEIGNEPNLSCFWTYHPDKTGEGSGDPNTPYGRGVHTYVQHLKNCYEAIKSVAPEIIVLIAGISEWKSTEYFEALGHEKAYLYFDEMAFHPYGDNPKDTAYKLRLAKENIARWPAPYNKFPIWVTEIGFHVEDWPTNPGKVESSAVKAEYLVETFKELLNEMDDIRPIFWYCFQEAFIGEDIEGYGIVSKSYENGKFEARRIQPQFDAYASIHNS